jgi:hypothetical protein
MSNTNVVDIWIWEIETPLAPFIAGLDWKKNPLPLPGIEAQSSSL